MRFMSPNLMMKNWKKLQKKLARCKYKIEDKATKTLLRLE